MASTKEAEAAAAATPLHRGLHLGDNGRPISTSGNGQDYSQTPTHQFAAGEDQSHSWLTRKMPFLQTRRGKIITVIVILVIIGGGLAGLAALPKKNNGNGNGGGSGSVGSGGDSEMITDDGYFYGQSPAVYPSPNMTGLGTWSASYTKARDLVGKMTLAEKLSLTSGVSSKTGCVGFIPPVERLNFTGLCLQDAGNGVRNADFVSSWPSGIHVGASWNKKLAGERGRGMGGEFKTKGVNIILGPVVGPAGRVVRGGRNWEGFSVDPYLAGSLVSETVSAIQGAGVITSTKHFIANEQETNRNPIDNVQSVSSNIDDRTMHELYLWPFQDAVRAGTGNIMCSYQRINNSYGCANSKTLNGLLKTELGFQGFVVSDWGAQHAGVATALSGMDMTMPDQGLWGSQLETAVTNGSVPESRITDMATRIIASWYHAGQDTDFPAPGIGMAPDLTKPHKIVDARNSTFRSTLLAGAVEGHVLVKNTKNTLPFKKPKLLSLFGYSAKNPDQNTPGSPSWTFGVASSNFSEFQQSFMLNHPATSHSVQSQSPIAINGTIYSGGGSGATSQGLTISPFEAIVAQAYEDGTALQWDFVSPTPNVNPMSDACVVFGNAFATEGLDRPGLSDEYTDGIILHVAGRCERTVVVFHNAGVRLVDGFVEHENVTGLIFAHLGGEMSGLALGRILWGLENPSGKLPYSVGRGEGDYGGMFEPVYGFDGEGGRFARFPQSEFEEGVWVDYRWFDGEGIEPRYEFGFGLSYSVFGYGGLGVEKGGGGNGTVGFGEFAEGVVGQGGREDLWNVLVRVRAEVTNKGEVDGMEVAQVYLSLPSSEGGDSKGGKKDGKRRDGKKTPVRQLRGFEKVVVGKGETVGVEFELTRRDLSVWDVERQGWRLDRGKYVVSVGGSSRDLPLKGEFTI